MRARLVLALFLLAGTCSCCDMLALLGMEPLEVGTQAPAFTLPSIADDEVALSDFAGRPVLLNFWSST